MRILTLYITRQFLLTFVITLVVFLFVMAVGNIFKVIDLFSRGVPGRLILQVFFYGIPASLIFAIPMSVLAAAYLVFSRLAIDRELVALKASGISLWQVVRPTIFLAGLLGFLCVYISADAAPRSHYARRTVLGKLGVETPLALLDEGRFIHDFPGFKIYIARKDGARIGGVVIHEFGSSGVKQTVRAKSGTLVADPDNPSRIVIVLKQVRIDQTDEQFPDDLSRTRRLSAEEYPVTIDVAELMQRGIIWKKPADLTMREILKTMHGSFLVSPEDIFDLDAWVRVLSEAPGPAADFIQAHLSDDTLEWLDHYESLPSRAARGKRAGHALGVAPGGAAAAGAELAAALSRDLNRLIAGPNLYTPERFAGVKLNNNTLALLGHKLSGEALLRFNRMLLEDAFPSLLARNFLAELKAQDVIMHRMKLMVEASTRLALSLSCFAFVLLGAALGMKIHRRESSIGVAVVLLMAFVFYLFTILADAMVNYPQWQPYLIVWIPFMASELIGYLLINRAN
ncbi:MAG: LptF/LptG family permease [Lentisphaerae bacterium]|nr:LptF/LptG family permease [Lentisphaerota bacterium]